MQDVLDDIFFSFHFESKSIQKLLENFDFTLHCKAVPEYRISVFIEVPLDVGQNFDDVSVVIIGLVVLHVSAKINEYVLH